MDVRPPTSRDLRAGTGRADGVADSAEPTQTQEVKLVLATPADARLIADAITLGNASKATLGHLPFAVYEDAARTGGLLVARERDVTIAYALFAVTVEHVRLTHLCVAAAHRHRGIARRMVQWISTQTLDRPGLRVKSRRDYGLAEFWTSLDFTRRGETRGRGRDGEALVHWWRDHGHPTLFATPLESPIVTASVDMNVLRDLADTRRKDHDEAAALRSDSVVDVLELVRTPALDLEIDRQDEATRLASTAEAVMLRSQPLDRERVREVHHVLVQAARAADASFAASDQGKADIRYVGEAIAGGLDVFITRDDRLTTVLGPTAERFGLRILRPVEVVIRIDELVRAEAYRPAALQSTPYRVALIGAGAHGIASLANRASAERVTDFRARIRELTRSGATRLGVAAPDGQLVAAVFLNLNASVLDVPLFRVASGALEGTLARQLTMMLRERAIAAGASVVRIADPHLSRTVEVAAAEDGFLPHAGAYHAFTIEVCGPAGAVEAAAFAAAEQARVPYPSALRPVLPAVAASDVERAWWPAKVTDSALQSYLVPIQQPFSSRLLGVPLSIFGRTAELGLSRQQVYYRSPTGLRLRYPARVLWYMSKSRDAMLPPGVIAASRLEEVIEDAPSGLHTRFRHLGVWEGDQVAAAASKGRAQALRFADTEVFAHHVPLTRLRELGIQAPQSPTSLTAAAFATLYLEGRRRD